MKSAKNTLDQRNRQMGEHTIDEEWLVHDPIAIFLDFVHAKQYIDLKYSF
jgi:hypothetical protein